ncbi:MAG: hypothetical protein ACRYGI_13760 [Janthinobacterium lividum]
MLAGPFRTDWAGRSLKQMKERVAEIEAWRDAGLAADFPDP